ncbi:caspase Dronc [Drosophila busckii]|nr:caspase Dronc [Drosophila busckii]
MEEERELGMLRKHREQILNNIDELISCTNYEQLVRETLRSGLISPTMRDNLKDLDGAQYKKLLSADQQQTELHRNFFKKITKRGPTAYDDLKEILQQLGFRSALRILQNVDDDSNDDFQSCTRIKRLSSKDIVDNCANSQPDDQTATTESRLPYKYTNGPLTPFTEPIDGPKRHVVQAEEIHTDQNLGTYSMQSEHNRGVLLVVNIIDFTLATRRRNGAEKDGNSLIDIFRQMGFTIFSYENLKQDQFFDLLNRLTSSDFVRNTECFVMALMTHGAREKEVDKVEFTDGSFEKVRAIIDHFQVASCPNLYNKPKVLIFPFCRGDAPDKGQPEPEVAKEQRPAIEYDGVKTNETVKKRNVSTLSDLMVCYATTPGHETHRDPLDGSWYIQKFCDVMAEQAHNTHMEDMLKKIQQKLSKMRANNNALQTGSYENHGFDRKLYFNPGYLPK